MIIICIKERLIHLHACSGVTPGLMKKFLEFDPSLKGVYQLSKVEFSRLFMKNEKEVEIIFRELHSSKIADSNKENLYNGMHIVTIFDEIYPDLLRQIYDPPAVLYCKGDLSLFNIETKISVVGTRDPSPNGLASLDKVILPLVKAGWVVVSGLAIGIDARAHNLALNHGGKTIAVLGSGFNFIYPHCHRYLALMISKNHLLISEYPPNHKPYKWNFPMRNRIISGLSKGTVIGEARRNSGSLITADLALQQGREVFAIPGSILDDRTEGTHSLIQQGAKLTKCSEDVLNEL